MYMDIYIDTFTYMFPEMDTNHLANLLAHLAGRRMYWHRCEAFLRAPKRKTIGNHTGWCPQT